MVVQDWCGSVCGLSVEQKAGEFFVCGEVTENCFQVDRQ